MDETDFRVLHYVYKMFGHKWQLFVRLIFYCDHSCHIKKHLSKNVAKSYFLFTGMKNVFLGFKNEIESSSSYFFISQLRSNHARCVPVIFAFTFHISCIDRCCVLCRYCGEADCAHQQLQHIQSVFECV